MTPTIEFANGYRMPVLAVRRSGRAVLALLPDAHEAEDADRDGTVWRAWDAGQIRAIDNRQRRAGR